MPTLLEVMESRLGIQEMPGAKHNPVIVGWFKEIGHDEVTDDETSWCAVAMSAACVEAGLPMPPLNVRMLARSFLTWGVKVPIENVQPGDVTVWPRGAAWQGHVNIVKEVRAVGARVEVRCIGGNQGGLKGGDAVTLTGWQDASKALDFRRPVPATVPALRKAGSTTIKDADNEEKLGIVGVLFAPIFEGIRAVAEGMFGSASPPKFASLPEGLSWWGTLLETAGRVASYAKDHPVLAAVLIIGIGMVVRSQLRKRGRVQEHVAGIPIAAEVAKLQEA
jgi:uncharacterized protein (TIGR02594 family)